MLGVDRLHQIVRGDAEGGAQAIVPAIIVSGGCVIEVIWSDFNCDQDVGMSQCLEEHI